MAIASFADASQRAGVTLVVVDSIRKALQCRFSLPHGNHSGNSSKIASSESTFDLLTSFKANSHLLSGETL